MTFKLDSDLSAVNSVLGAIGQAPVTKLEFENPEISLCYNLLQECNVDVQTWGWQFNTEYCLFLAPDVNNHIIIPEGTLQATLSQDPIVKYSGYNVTVREGKLYNLTQHTFDFSGWKGQRQVQMGGKWTWEPANGVNLDVITLLDFDDLPAVAQRFITYKAAERAATQLVSSPELMKMIMQQIQTLRASMTNFECVQADANFMGFPNGTSYNTFQSFYPLAR